MIHAQLIMRMRLPKVLQISLVSLLSLPLLNLLLHDGEVTRELELLAIAEPDVVVWFAFQELDALGFEAGVEFGKGAVEEVGEEEKGGALVETVAGGVEEGAATTGEVVLLDYGDFEAGLCEASCC